MSALKIITALVLAPCCVLYAAWQRVHTWLYERGLRTVAQPGLPTISVGGLEAGGTGKTPVAGYLLAAILRAGKTPGLVTRGYGRATRGLQVRHLGREALARQIGDEPAMLVKSGLDVRVAACASRRVGADALTELGCDSLVLDDGFAHRALARHLDLVVVRGESPLGCGRLLPWGSLREPPAALGRAGFIWLHFRHDQANAARIVAARKQLAPWCRPGVPWAASQAVAGAIYDRLGAAQRIFGVEVVAAAGIARPGGFFADLRACGARVVAQMALADHHGFGPRTVRRLVTLARLHDAKAVVVTAKDFVKLSAVWPREAPLLWQLTQSVVLVEGAQTLKRALLAAGLGAVDVG